MKNTILPSGNSTVVSPEIYQKYMAGLRRGRTGVTLPEE